MDFTPFYQICNNLPEKEQQWASVFCRNIDEVFGESSAQLHNIDKVCRLFYGCGNGLSKAQFYRKRKLVMLFYNWLLENKYVSQKTYDKVAGLKMEDVVITDELNNHYFISLDSALGFVNLVGTTNGFSSSTGLLNIKSLVILTWHLVDVSEIIEIRKNDLYDDNVMIATRDGKNRKVMIDPKYISILKDYASIDRHSGFPSGKVQDYLPSSFLFRSAKNAKMSPNNIGCMLKRFNDEAKQYGHALSLVDIKRNGIFCLLRDSGCDAANITSKIQDILQKKDRENPVSRAELFAYAHLYQGWKSKFNDGMES